MGGVRRCHLGRMCTGAFSPRRLSTAEISFRTADLLRPESAALATAVAYA
jgi:hypothetical protein